ncbi:hypothetical protein HPG69_014155 [Diceros bicornis minor]|uniref:NADP-dependent oxidoreductase domain-containing protein n=1 Tax=Diceros bicornis minor TaxID=77932 RepID=A0A7J7FJ42_DICBM|nr:hypothetical protein HPG69_014155 [Diceros bicornis minor]
MDPKCWHVKLNDGHFIPVLGFDTYAAEEFPKNKAVEDIKLGINAGFHHIDCAHGSSNEKEPEEELFPQDEHAKPIFDTVDLYATWKAMEKCKEARLTKSIGVDQSTPVLLDDPVLCAMAKKYERTPALIALRYQLQCGVVVLAKSINEGQMKENM